MPSQELRDFVFVIYSPFRRESQGDVWAGGVPHSVGILACKKAEEKHRRKRKAKCKAGVQKGGWQ